MFLFSKCRPTNTSLPPVDEEQANRTVGLAALQFSAMFKPRQTAADVENIEPYSFIKEGNIEKMLEALQDKRQYYSQFAWEIALKYPKSPALYLLVIARLPIEMPEELKGQVIDALKARKIDDELPATIKSCFEILGKRSAQEAWDYGSDVMNSLNIRPSLFHDAVVGATYGTNHRWQTIFDKVSNERFRLNKPTPPEKHCCFPKGWCK